MMVIDTSLEHSFGNFGGSTESEAKAKMSGMRAIAHHFDHILANQVGDLRSRFDTSGSAATDDKAE